jgi:hypothetical protein
MTLLRPPNSSILAFFRAAKDDGKEKLVVPKPDFESNIQNKNSFTFEPSNFPLKSTQQLNVDWSRFENHTFFSSAEVKVGVAIDQIVNKFPFDGTKAEVEDFFENLSGFDRWVLSQFPVNKGFIDFTAATVYTEDRSGSTNPSLSRNNSGNSVINPKTSDFTVEFYVRASDSDATENIFKKEKGLINFLKITKSRSTAQKSKISFKLKSGSEEREASIEIENSPWNHVAFVWENKIEKIKIFLNGSLKKEENFKQINLDIDVAPIILGPFTGALKEFRVFHEARTDKQINRYLKKSIFSTQELKLYYKFNEPKNIQNNIVLDHSGNSLHAILDKPQNRGVFSGLETNPLTKERDEFSVVLFPNHPEIISFSNGLLKEAIEYDKENPNLITKLIPEHYLQIGSLYENTDDLLDADRKQNYSYNSPGNPGQYKPNSIQVILSFLYIWSKFFDEIKLYIDSFSTLHSFDYEAIGSSPDNFLLDFLTNSGFFMPMLFNNSTLQQYIDGENIEDNAILSEFPLKKIQSEITRRIIISLPSIIRSKGTQESIKSFLRSVGINPENSLRIREYGGAKSRKMVGLREKRTEDLLFYNLTTETKVQINLGSTFKEEFTFEGLYQWDFIPNEDQIIARATKGNAEIFKLSFVKEANSLKLVAQKQDEYSPVTTTYSLENNLHLFSEKRQINLSFGKKVRKDTLNNQFSKIFMRVGSQEDGEKVFFDEIFSQEFNSAGYDFDNLVFEIDGADLASNISCLRAWNKFIEFEEYKEHIRNPRSVGRLNTKENQKDIVFNFFDKQDEKITTIVGILDLLDSSGNYQKIQNPGAKIIDEEGRNGWKSISTIFSRLTPYFDDLTTTEKIRIRGYEDYNYDRPFWSSKAPYHEIPVGEEPTDDNRFSVEFSLVDALNKDIINIFATLEEIESAIGRPEVMFEPDYQDLEKIQDQYFQKLSGKLSFTNFFELFKWFDSSLGRFIEQLVPRKTSFKGTNFVIESHMLERSKLQIESSGMYEGAGINSSLYSGVIS